MCLSLNDIFQILGLRQACACALPKRPMLQARVSHVHCGPLSGPLARTMVCTARSPQATYLTARASPIPDDLCRRLKMEQFFPDTFRLDLSEEREAFFAQQNGKENRKKHAEPGVPRRRLNRVSLVVHVKGQIKIVSKLIDRL